MRRTLPPAEVQASMTSTKLAGPHHRRSLPVMAAAGRPTCSWRASGIASIAILRTEQRHELGNTSLLTAALMEGQRLAVSGTAVSSGPSDFAQVAEQELGQANPQKGVPFSCCPDVCQVSVVKVLESTMYCALLWTGRLFYRHRMLLFTVRSPSRMAGTLRSGLRTKSFLLFTGPG